MAERARARGGEQGTEGGEEQGGLPRRRAVAPCQVEWSDAQEPSPLRQEEELREAACS